MTYLSKPIANNRKRVVIALSRGRILSDSTPALTALGFPTSLYTDDPRMLVFNHPVQQLAIIIARSSDVATLVHHGSVDIGIVGKDVLIEHAYPNLLELDDLGYSKCKMVFAKPKGSVFHTTKPLVVATKYPNTAKEYLAGKIRQLKIVKLHGSIEMAPSIGLSDAIVDVSATGKSLAVHKLDIQEVFYHSTARLVVNQAAYISKSQEIERVRYNFCSTLTKREPL